MNLRDQTGKGPVSAAAVASFCLGVETGNQVNEIIEAGRTLDDINSVRDMIRRSDQRLDQCDGSENLHNRRKVEQGIEDLTRIEVQLLEQYAAANKGGVASDLTTQILCMMGAAVAGVAPIP